MADEYSRWASELFDPGRAGEKPEALRGVRVLDPGIVVMGPVAAALLAEFGAEVIKIEMPGTGDRLIRAVTPWARFWQNAALNQFQEGRNKYHVTIDLHQPDGQRLFRDLAARSDVVIDNFVSGTMDEWGLGVPEARRD
jgi:crotonobetainyl-CoA:carnitine CoA-transferase CaiB-like acyl-CoA transferase